VRPCSRLASQRGENHEQFKSTFSARIPLKRYGTNEELARLNLFLASDESSYATGQVIAVDGGLTAGLI
jgi:NAD(P)-dependent dehydrogenase (short-subunit alcohol dehydrogenase family)